MKKRSHLEKLPILLFSMLLSTPAYAYLDPGTGSILLQGLLGGIAGAAVFLKLYWHKFMSFFGRNKPDASDDNIDDKN